MTYSIQFTSTISIQNRHIINKTYITENLDKKIILMLIWFLFEIERQNNYKLKDKNEYVRISFGAGSVCESIPDIDQIFISMTQTK